MCDAAINGGAAESVGVADINKDGKLDIVSAESWYEAPGWTKRPIRTIPVSSGYVDSFSDLPLDVDGEVHGRTPVRIRLLPNALRVLVGPSFVDT